MKTIKKISLPMVLALAVFAAGAWAQTSTTSNPKPKPKKARAAVTAAEVQELKDAIAAQQAQMAQQQQQIQELRDELHRRDQTVQQAQSAASDAAAKADAAQAQAVQQQQAVGELKTDVTDLKANATNTALSIQETQKNINIALDNPIAIHYKGITITPGGFAAAETVRRSRALASDINTPFNSLTMPGASQSSVSEFFGSGRQSRLSLLAEGKLKSATLRGYYEGDFLNSGETSNNNESNSYPFRQRQAWGQAALDSGWTFTGGQMWSLATETKHGVDNRTEATPMTIDPQYTVGFSWARQYGIRLAKDFGDHVWLAVSAEDSQATVTTHSNETNFLIGSAGNASGLYNSAASTTCSFNATTNAVVCTPVATYSFNPSPDVIAKLAFEPGFGHYEIFGIYDRFRDRIFPCGGISATGTCDGATGPTALGAFNSSKNAGGFGVNARWTIAHHFDFGLHGVGGSGIGRYGTGGLPDSAVRADGTFALLKNYQGLATLEWHGPRLDVYFNGGIEYAGRAPDYDPIINKNVGYGNPLFSNSGCYTETPPTVNTGFMPGSLASCTADTKSLLEGTGGFWYRFYTGPKGKFQFGMQYSYVTRQTWSGVGPGGSGAPGVSPEGLDGMVFTSFRYYLP